MRCFKKEPERGFFCYRTPNVVNGPFVALGDSFDLAPSDPFLNFSFPSYGNFREGDPPTQQKVLPLLTVRALLVLHVVLTNFVTKLPT